MLVHVNGRELHLDEGATITDALAEFGAPATGIAVALDGDVVSRSSWPSTLLWDGVTLEVLTAVQGG